jgi:hypothetical protein
MIGAFLYVLTATIAENNDERERISAYFADLLIQTNIQFQSERDAWAHERGILLERIQRPDFIPPSPVVTEPIANDEIQDDLHLVGSIRDSQTPPPPDDIA